MTDMPQKLTLYKAFENALVQGEQQDTQDGHPFLTFYFDPKNFGASPPYKLGAVHKLTVAFQTALFPEPHGYLPLITDEVGVVGYGKTSEGLVYMKFTYDGLAEEISDVIRMDRFLCHLAAANVVRVESSAGTRVELRQVRFKTEDMNANPDSPALI